jgi:hypothetical protein
MSSHERMEWNEKEGKIMWKINRSKYYLNRWKIN